MEFFIIILVLVLLVLPLFTPDHIDLTPTSKHKYDKHKYEEQDETENNDEV